MKIIYGWKGYSVLKLELYVKIGPKVIFGYNFNKNGIDGNTRKIRSIYRYDV